MPTSDILGIVNGHEATPEIVRGGDVCSVGVASLMALGVRRVICLKNIRDDSEREIQIEKAIVEEARLTWLWRPLENQGLFSYDDGSKVPAILELIEQSLGRVFVHCHHGSDRTGVVVACWRIKHQGWSADQAIAEMKRYGAAWYNRGMRQFVKEFAENVAKEKR